MIKRSILFLLFLAMTLPIFAQDTVAAEILRQVNSARSNQGTPPLAFNSALQTAAQIHSQDMARADVLSHVGTDGSQFWERIADAGYTLTTGAENVLSRADTSPTEAFNQWFNSTAHRTNMLNPDYAEVGIAYAQSATGRYYFTMVLANRANFVMPTIAPTNTPIPSNTPLPTSTILPPTAVATFTPAPTQLATATFAPTMPPTQRPTSTIAPLLTTNTPAPIATEFIPPEIRLTYDTDTLVLENISGRVLNLANLVFESESGSMPATRWNTDFLTQPLSGFTTGDCLQVWRFTVDFLPTPHDCRYRHGWIATADDSAFWYNADVFTVRNGGDLVGICLAADGVCDVNISTPIDDISIVDPVTFGQLPDIRLEFIDSAFTLTNIAGRDLDLRGLAFRSESGTLSVERWNTEFLSQPLNRFADGGCLQAFPVSIGEQAPPDTCEIRHAWIVVSDDGDFWRQTEQFTVVYNGVVIRRCLTTENSCTASLSSDFGALPAVSPQTQPTATPQTTLTTEFDVQLVITQDSVALVNSSNRAIDISNLTFQSDTRSFSASRWLVPELTTDLTLFPAGDCVQVWGVNTLLQSAPDNCEVRHSWIAVTFDAQFWRDTHVFSVFDNGFLLTTCETRVETCNFNLQ